MHKATPILIGAGQNTIRSGSLDDFVHPVEMMKICAQRAAEDAGSRAVLKQLDAVHVVNIFGWNLRNPPAELAEAIDARPVLTEYTALGGNAPQWLVNRVADDLAAGKSRLALLAGCEVLHSVALAKAANIDLGAQTEQVGVPVVGDDRFGSHKVEVAHFADLPVRVYPIIENALRAKTGMSMADQRHALGRFAETYSRVASRNPHAWFPIERSAEEAVDASLENRMIAFPYTKYLNAIMAVDQAAALIMTTTDVARSLGIPEERWVYLHGGQDANDIWFLSHRPDITDSPAINTCVEDALQQAGLELDDIDCFDLYSCFPCMPRLTRRALGISADDPREMTLTGGLPYFGGPGSNYSMHAIAEALHRCKANRQIFALVTANGWYCTKHAVGIYGSQPPKQPWSRMPPEQFQRQLELPTPLEIDLLPSGNFTVDGYTVWHNRSGQPQTGILTGRTDAGKRAWAQTPPGDIAVLEAMMAEEWIGKTGRITGREGEVNLVEF